MASGNVDDYLVVNITNPTPAVGPLIVVFPITLAGAIPATGKLSITHIPGSVVHDYSAGLIYQSDNVTALSIYRDFAVAPGATYTFKMMEFDALSGSPASWASPTRPYGPGDTQDITFRNVMPFTALPQVEARIDAYGFDAAGTLSRSYFTPQSVSSGTWNDSGAWTGATLTSLGVIFIIGSAYVGTITHTFQLAKNF